MAAALDASVCEILHRCRRGVLSADPNGRARCALLAGASYEAAIEMASSGAKVRTRAPAEICMSYNIPIHIRSSFHLKEGDVDS